jgi:ribose 5-phosphate isomerase A
MACLQQQQQHALFTSIWFIWFFLNAYAKIREYSGFPIICATTMEDKATNTKKLAAEKALEYIRDGMVLGLGTGSTAYWAIRGVGNKVRNGLKIKAVATSLQSEHLAREEGIPVLDFSEVDHIDLTIDGADEVDGKLNLIKGGGGALLREKIVAAATEYYIIIVDESKLVSTLGKFPLPVEVAPFGWEMTRRRLEELGCTTALRMATDKSVFLSDNGHYILDCSFGKIDDPALLHNQVNGIVGVMENGLFIQMADLVLVGGKDGGTKDMRR